MSAHDARGDYLTCTTCRACYAVEFARCPRCAEREAEPRLRRWLWLLTRREVTA